MYVLTNFHANYPDARIVLANCGETVSLSCQNQSENNSSSMVGTNLFESIRECVWVFDLLATDNVVSFV